MKKLSNRMDRGAVKALQLTARYGATEAVRTSAQTSPRPRATGTFDRSWIVTKLSDGALLSNTAQHSRFVEVGRRPGKQPPVKAIEAWMSAKKIGKTQGRGRRARLRSVAWIIARKIGRKGTRGRYILKRTIPKMRKRLALELAVQMRKVFQNAAK